MRISLDTNVLVYAANRDAGDRHRAAVGLIERAIRADCILTLQTLAEFYTVVTRKGHLDTAAALSLLIEWRAVFPVHAADEEVLDEAIDATREHGLAFWDAMLWATVKQAGCRVLITEDMQSGRTLGGVAFLNPFRPDTAEIIATVLPG